MICCPRAHRAAFIRVHVASIKALWSTISNIFVCKRSLLLFFNCASLPSFNGPVDTTQWLNARSLVCSFPFLFFFLCRTFVGVASQFIQLIACFHKIVWNNGMSSNVVYIHSSLLKESMYWTRSYQIEYRAKAIIFTTHTFMSDFWYNI